MVEDEARKRFAVEVADGVIATRRQVRVCEQDGGRVGELPEVERIVRAAHKTEGEAGGIGIQVQRVGALKGVRFIE